MDKLSRKVCTISIYIRILNGTRASLVRMVQIVKLCIGINPASDHPSRLRAAANRRECADDKLPVGKPSVSLVNQRLCGGETQL